MLEQTLSWRPDMQLDGYGGRGDPLANWSALRLLSGVLTGDPAREPRPGWNQRHWTVTPFGPLSDSGAIYLQCGICGHMVYPVDREAPCRCDFSAHQDSKTRRAGVRAAFAHIAFR